MSGPNRVSARAHVLGCAAAVILAACDSPSAPLPPAEIRALNSDLGSAVAGQEPADSLTVLVLDARGRPVPGATVAFSTSPTSGTVTPATRQTGTDGTARACWTLGASAGVQSARAELAGSSLAPVVFTVTAVAGAPAELRIVAGDRQTGPAGKPLPQALVVSVSDLNGNAVEGVEIAWVAQLGRLEPVASLTDDGGLAAATWLLDTKAGAHEASASIGGHTVRFLSQAVAGPVARMEVPGCCFLLLLHSAVLRIEVVAFDVYDNPVERVVDWSSSNADVIMAAPEIGLPRSAILSTRGVGTAVVTAVLDEVTATVQVEVFGTVDGGFTTRAIGFGARAFNDHDEVAASRSSFCAECDDARLLLWRDGKVTEWPIGNRLGGILTYAMNNARSITQYVRSLGHTGLFGGGDGRIVRNGIIENIPLPHATPADINEHETVVGSTLATPCWPACGRRRGFVLIDGQITTLPHIPIDDPYVSSTAAVAVNDVDQVAVNMHSSDMPVRAYLWQAGDYTPIPAPAAGCDEWYATDLNNHGAVLLVCQSEAKPVGAYVWNGHAAVDLAPLLYAESMNDAGAVVGSGPDGVYLWRDGHALRLYETSTPGFARINRHGHILLNTGRGAYLLVPE